MSFVVKKIPMIISSSAASGAMNKTADGHRFEVRFEDGVNIPKDSHNCSVTVDSATVWWSVPNIVTGVNDKLYITGPAVNGTLTNYDLTIPQGLYDLPQLNETIQILLANAGSKVAPDPLVTFSGDESTGKIQMEIPYTNVSVDFTVANNCRVILGFDSAVYGPYASAPITVISPNIAYLNPLEYFLIHSDLTAKGIRVNNKYGQVISQVLIDKPPGSQIISEPRHPPAVACGSLIGERRTHASFWLTDELGEPVNTGGLDWSVRLTLRYEVPHIIR